MSLTRSFFEDPFSADPFFSTGLGWGGSSSDLGWGGPSSLLGGRRMNIPMGRGDVFEHTASSTIAPALDIVETENKIYYHFDLPGINNKDSINVSLDNNILKVECDKLQCPVCPTALSESDKKNINYRRHERSWGKYERSVRIPGAADVSKITTNYNNGVLTVTFDKFVSQGASSNVRKLQIL